MARRACSIGLIERPLVIAMVAGALTGHLDIALPLGIVFELFWLDVIPLGAVIPPVASLNFFLVFCLALIFDWHEPAQFVLPVLLTLPAAYVSAMVERWQYARNNNSLEYLDRWLHGASGGYSPSRIVVQSLVCTALSQGTLFIVLFAGCYALLLSGADKWLDAMSQFPMSWTVLYCFAAIGAIVALRTRRAYALLALCIAVLLLGNGVSTIL